MELAKQISEWIKTQVKIANKKGIVLGLSGGIDSAVVASLSKKAMGENVLGLILPCKSNAEDKKHAAAIAKELGVKTEEIVLDKVYEEILSFNKKSEKIAKANLKPRLRMLTLYYFANSLDYMVAGTGNKSELMVGYFTKYGDGGVDILPIGGLLKTEVRKLAKELEIHEDILNKAPSAGLWENQTDEGEMGISYEDLDKTIEAIEKNDTRLIQIELLSKVKQMIANSEHKRKSIPIFNP